MESLARLQQARTRASRRRDATRARRQWGATRAGSKRGATRALALAASTGPAPMTRALHSLQVLLDCILLPPLQVLLLLLLLLLRLPLLHAPAAAISPAPQLSAS